MQQYLCMLSIIAALCTHPLISAETDRKANQKKIKKIMRTYQQKDAEIAHEYTCLKREYKNNNLKRMPEKDCAPESLTLSLLGDLAESRPEHTTTFYPSMIQENDIMYYLEKLVARAKEEFLHADRWVGGKSEYTAHFFNISAPATFKPFMQKVIIPTGSTLFAWGDTHGCIQSLVRTLQQLQKWGYLDDNFKIIKPNTYLVYLGDCVDRGCYGLEVLYTLMRLKVANPDNVFLIRGNHEDAYINRNTSTIRFDAELNYKQFRHKKELYRLYDLFIPVLYIGSGSGNNRSYIMCCHGGLEIGVSPASLITASDDVTFMAIKGLNRAEMINALPHEMREAVSYIVPPAARANTPIKSPTAHYFGYMWGEFLIEDPQEIVRYQPHKGWKYGKALTRHLLDRDGGPEHRIKSIVRAHQHHGVMQEHMVENKGYYSLWDNMVFTVLSAPAVPLLPPCPYDSMMKITTASQWKDWHFKHLSKPIPTQYTIEQPKNR